MILFTAGLNPRPDFGIEGRDPDCVLLPQQEVGQRRGDLARVFVFRQLARTEQHRLGQVDEQRRAKIRFFFVLLDIVPVGFRPDLPVNPANVVTRRVLTVLRKLDGLSKVGTAVQTRQKPFHHVASEDFQS